MGFLRSTNDFLGVEGEYSVYISFFTFLYFLINMKQKEKVLESGMCDVIKIRVKRRDTTRSKIK